jgi:hypothetical protein
MALCHSPTFREITERQNGWTFCKGATLDGHIPALGRPSDAANAYYYGRDELLGIVVDVAIGAVAFN